MDKVQNKKARGTQIALSAVGIVLCVVFGFMLMCNLVIIVKGTINPQRPPSVFGITPMVVLSGSMSGDAPDHIEVGDLVFIGKADPDKLKIGDIIAFMETGSSVVVTHRIIETYITADGKHEFITKGDANNTEDAVPVNEENIVGIYRFRIAKIGNFALFLQQPLGMILFIGIPLFAFIIYDIIRRQKIVGREKQKTAKLESELERLRSITDSQQKNFSDNLENPDNRE